MPLNALGPYKGRPRKSILLPLFLASVLMLSGQICSHIFIVHMYFREQIVAMLGEEKAAEVLATLPAADMASTPLEEELSASSAACPPLAPRPQPSGKQSLHGTG